ncbi:hypothetical protein C8R45DRAFT_1115252 [Mycena sanguinolenta]|nr:hypothetical protein C8R45DRAFT_1115252 [Mycena sanguinolenta]
MDSKNPVDHLPNLSAYQISEDLAYPVLSLPTEITTRIFVECLPDDGATSLAECAPLLLMRVCRQWKDITLSSCQLWSSLRIESYSRDKIMVPRGTLEMLQTWFSRARARPLALTVTYNYSSMSEFRKYDELDISSFFDRLWRLNLPASASSCRRLIPFQTSLPRLQSLCGTFPMVAINDVLKNAPLLADLHWERPQQTKNIEFCGFTSNALTALHVTSDTFSSAEFLSILQSCPSLHHLACPVRVEDSHGHTPLAFPNLLSLCLVSYLDSPIHALELVTLPNLYSLGCSSSFNPAVTLPFLSRSACVIRELEWNRCGYATNIAESLRIFSSLERLYIEAEVANCLEAIDPESHRADGSPPILPKLRHVEIFGEDEPMSADYQRIIKIVHGRRAHPDTQELQSLHIHALEREFEPPVAGDFPPHGPIAAELRALTAGGGLDLKFITV